ncbi:hypothetical protein B9Z55_006279 [Caenorhabditis nigoni]|uniref:Uncharacterized protein n=1 Tax=Caenorhabditis nigoni TaxID=1611254 RepID=A0A2G5V4F4_9PELO|nr:hypothetical protein B9Z55_006279 [Caenorhabditis nigoni]
MPLGNPPLTPNSYILSFRIILNEESRGHLSEEEYINWFLHRVFTLDSFLEIISFSIICFYIGGGFLFLALICCHIVARYLKLEW